MTINDFAFTRTAYPPLENRVEKVMSLCYKFYINRGHTEIRWKVLDVAFLRIAYRPAVYAHRTLP